MLSCRPFSPASILDIATGTGDLAISMHRRLKANRIIGADISEGMMEVGRQKVAEAGLSDHITFEYQDCTALTYPDNSFDAVTAAFGVRNFENIEQGIAEMYRVLKPGGHLMILELSSPVHFPMKQLYNIYSKVVIPTVGRLLSKEHTAYSYLPASIKVVPQGKVMTDLLSRVGFSEARSRTFHLRHLFAIHGQQGRFANHPNSINHLKFTGHAKIWFNRISPRTLFFKELL